MSDACTRLVGAEGTGSLVPEQAGRERSRAGEAARRRGRLGLHREEMPHLGDFVNRRQMLALAAFVLVALAVLYVVIPQLPGVKHTWDQLNNGDAWWIGVALVLEIASMASYIALFHGVHVPPGSPITLRDSYKITMASLAATRLFSAGGAAGVALTAWSLRRSGMPRREVATRMIAFLVLLYGVYVAGMIICGVGLYVGLFAGPAPFAITIVPAIAGAVAMSLFTSIAFLPKRLEQRLRAFATRRLLRRVAAGPASLVAGVRYAKHKLRHPDWAMAGAVSWWALNIGVLYASFRAFGHAPPVAVVAQAYFVGMLANLLPVPGGIGVVDGGMIGACVALGVGFHVALIAVLTYRLFAFWLPTIPGALAYVQLRRTVHRWDRRETALAAPA
jgi:uncharacterized protein (TIRG00374 family)